MTVCCRIYFDTIPTGRFTGLDEKEASGSVAKQGGTNMQWDERYLEGEKPDMKQIGAAIGSPLWSELCEFLEETYSVLPSVEYSKCSMQKGWNVKYKKGSKALCTLYPNENFFTCLVSVGAKEAMAAECAMQSCTEYVRELYFNTRLFNGGRWLMIDVTDEEVLRDAKMLIGLRVPPKKRA